MAGEGKGISPIMFSTQKTKEDADGYEPYKMNPKKTHSKKRRTPEHNGKVERSHRIDHEKFCRTLLFRSLSDLAQQGARWMQRHNGMPLMALNMKSPNEMKLEKLANLMRDAGEVRCPKLLKRFTSSAD